jgi:hypothetical protein
MKRLRTSCEIEIGLREPLLTPIVEGQAQTALRHWVRGDALIETFPVRCLSYPEAMAEKLRAALCRREIAIRDFFDVDYAIRKSGFNPREDRLIELLRRKIEIPGNDSVNVSEDRMRQLLRQVEAQLRPVLRKQDFERFDLDRAIAAVREVARALEQ